MLDMYMTDLYTYVLNLEFNFNRNLYTTIVKENVFRNFFIIYIYHN